MNRKRKQDPSPPPPKRPLKPLKGIVDDVYPFELPNPERLTPQMRQYINDLEREYIDRYNILHANRAVFAEVIESVASELDGKGIAKENLEDICKIVKVRPQKEQGK